MMTQPAFNTTLSPDRLDYIWATANAWRQRGYAQEADNLLIVAGLAAPAPQPSALPPGVADFAAYFRARRQAVQR